MVNSSAESHYVVSEQDGNDVGHFLIEGTAVVYNKTKP